MTAMRILMVTDFYPPLVGGVEVVVSALARGLSRRGHEVSVATIGTNGAAPLSVDDGIRIHRIQLTAARVDALFTQRRPWAPPVPDPEAVAALRRIVRDERPHVVHGHDWLARSFIPLKRGARAAFVMSLHYYTSTCAKKSLMYRGEPCAGPGLLKCLQCAGDHYGRARGAVVTLGNFAFAAAERAVVDTFLPVSEATAAGNALGPGAPYEVIPNFLLPPAPLGDRERSLLSELPEEPFVLFVGDLRREKGIEVLLEAYGGLVESPPLVLIGKVWDESPRRLPENVRLFREWPNSAVREAQRRSLALVLPSLWPEPFGMVVLEALAAGRPVIGSRIGGIADLVQHERNGVLVEPGNVGALRVALERVGSDAQLRARLGREAVRASSAYSEAAVVPRVEAAYRRARERACRS